MALATNEEILTSAQYKQISEFIYKISGINLGDGKEGLLRARMTKLLRASKTGSVEEYIKRMEADTSGSLLISFLDVVTTNKTDFFRENQHFIFFSETVLSSLSEICQPGEPLRIWCAASSTGEEPYTIAMVLQEHRDLWAKRGAQIFASDLSSKVLQHAAQCIYAKERVSNIPKNLLYSYFQKGTGPYEGFVRVRKPLRTMIRFSRINLMEKFDFAQKFHIIFCRNVMIYFDRPTQERLVAKFYDIMLPQSYLFVGHSESLTGIDHKFAFVKPAIYRKE